MYKYIFITKNHHKKSRKLCLKKKTSGLDRYVAFIKDGYHDWRRNKRVQKHNINDW